MKLRSKKRQILDSWYGTCHHMYLLFNNQSPPSPCIYGDCESCRFKPYILEKDEVIDVTWTQRPYAYSFNMIKNGKRYCFYCTDIHEFVNCFEQLNSNKRK